MFAQARSPILAPISAPILLFTPGHLSESALPSGPSRTSHPLSQALQCAPAPPAIPSKVAQVSSRSSHFYLAGLHPSNPRPEVGARVSHRDNQACGIGPDLELLLSCLGQVWEGPSRSEGQSPGVTLGLVLPGVPISRLLLVQARRVELLHQPAPCKVALCICPLAQAVTETRRSGHRWNALIQTELQSV